MNAPTISEINKDRQAAIQADTETYYARYPASPAANQQPAIIVDHGRYVAVLGSSIEQAIIGFGSSVCSALRAFDYQYTALLPRADG